MLVDSRTGVTQAVPQKQLEERAAMKTILLS